MGAGVVDLCPLNETQLQQCKAGKDSSFGTVSVAVRQNNILGTAFHPELTEDTFWHRYFRDMVLNEGFYVVRES
jgi:glutamine amidotransferase PdxT